MTEQLREAEIFDCDGTLCDVRGIRHYVTGPDRDFHRFHMASQFCPPNHDVVEQAREARANGRVIIVVTARLARYRMLTRKWLNAWDIPFDVLRTRKDGDFRKDVVIKREILAELRQNFIVVKATDDNPSVTVMWQEEGIETRTVPGWNEQFTEEGSV